MVYLLCMHVSKILLVTLIFLLTFNCVKAQRPGRVIKSRNHFTTPKVRGNQAKIICPDFDENKFPFHGLGFKFGDPVALTYSYYASKRIFFALDVGKAASVLYNRYYRENFNFYVKADSVLSGESSLTYLNHRVKPDFVAELKMLYQVEISNGLQAYAGMGWEWKSTKLVYDYVGNKGSTDPLRREQFGSFARNRFTMGPEFIIGIAYRYTRIPISAFMEIENFMDVYADPGWQRVEGGVGLRYLF